MKRERIQLLVDVTIEYDTPQERRYVIADAKENVMSVSSPHIAVPTRARLVKPKKTPATTQ